MLQRAYSTLEIKSVDAEQRIIEGIASTPEPDRQGDVMESEGAKFRLPISLLWQHNAEKPIGNVISAEVTKSGIKVKAQLAQSGVLPFIDEAWALIKAGLVRGLSIGWTPLAAPTVTKSGDRRYSSWEWLELSAVTIPANQSATIALVKSIDQGLAALGTPPEVIPPVVTPASGAPDHSQNRMARKDARPMTIQERIKDLEASRQAKSARMNDIILGTEGRTTDPAEQEEFDTLEREVTSIDGDLRRLNVLSRENQAKAQPVAVQGVQPTGYANPVTIPKVTVKSNLPKGTAFTRFVMSMANGKGDYMRSLEHAKQWHDSTPEVELMVKAAVAAGTTTDATWAGPLAVARPLVDEFLELLRPRTLIGRIPGLRQVPFNVSVPAQTSGGTYGWVGQGAGKPVTKMDFSTVTLGFAKAAGIVVLTEELVRLSTPSAEATVREQMIAGMQQFLDGQFVDPAIAEVAGVNPASITNGAPSAAASGTTGAAARADLAAAISALAAADIPLEGTVFLMNETNAFAIGIALNALGQPMFPGVGMNGGNILGVPVVVTNVVGNRVILVHAPSILFADDGGVNIDASREASIIMNDAPGTVVQAAGAAPIHTSLWQNNLVGLRAERFITWKRARTNAVRVITAAAYTGA